MIKHGFEDLNLDDIIADKKDKLCEYFVKFYGEKNREVIQEKFESINYLYLYIEDTNLQATFSNHFVDLINKTDINDKGEQERLLKEFTRLYNYFKSKECDESLIASEVYNYIVGYLQETFKVKGKYDELSRLVPFFIEMVQVDFPFLDENFQQRLSNVIFEDKPQNSSFLTQYQKMTSSASKQKMRQTLKEFGNKIVDNITTYILDNYPQCFGKENAFRKHLLDILTACINGDIDYSALQLTSINLDNEKLLNFVILRDPRMLNDNYIVHETNHAVSSSAKLIDEFICVKNGVKPNLSMLEKYSDFKNVIKLKGYEEYRAINEVLNDYLTGKILEIMEKDGFKISPIKNSTSIYSAILPIFKDFFDRHLNAIKNKYISDNSKDLIKYFGEENFNELATVMSKMLNIILKENKFYIDENYGYLPLTNDFNSLTKISEEIIKNIETFIAKKSIKRRERDE